jgi:hypothetical protein
VAGKAAIARLASVHVCAFRHRRPVPPARPPRALALPVAQAQLVRACRAHSDDVMRDLQALHSVTKRLPPPRAPLLRPPSPATTAEILYVPAPREILLCSCGTFERTPPRRAKGPRADPRLRRVPTAGKHARSERCPGLHSATPGPPTSSPAATDNSPIVATSATGTDATTTAQ